MSFVHLMLEVYCGFDYREQDSAPEPKFCQKGINNPGYHCFQNQCPFVSYTECPNEFAYVGEMSIVKDNESSIGFGGEMEPDNDKETKKFLSLWENICKSKIAEAYDEYMSKKNDII